MCTWHVCFTAFVSCIYLRCGFNTPKLDHISLDAGAVSRILLKRYGKEDWIQVHFHLFRYDFFCVAEGYVHTHGANIVI